MHSDSNSFREENERKKYRRDHPVNANLSLIDVNDMIEKIDTGTVTCLLIQIRSEFLFAPSLYYHVA